MGRLSWQSAPVLAPQVSIPEPPQTDNPALNDWMQQVYQAVQGLAEPNTEVQTFLDDIVDTVKELDRDSLNDLSTISETAGATYTANEQTMLANLKTAVNGLLANL
jgi:hypothetical protein